MANIKISTQTSTATAPPKANYGDLWVGKDGSFYATNQNGDAIKMALKSEVTAAQTTANAALPRASFESYGTMSTVEHWTGRYDLEGNRIYAKTILFNIAANSNTRIETNIPVANLKLFRLASGTGSSKLYEFVHPSVFSKVSGVPSNQTEVIFTKVENTVELRAWSPDPLTVQMTLEYSHAGR